MENRNHQQSLVNLSFNQSHQNRSPISKLSTPLRKKPSQIFTQHNSTTPLNFASITKSSTHINKENLVNFQNNANIMSPLPIQKSAPFKNKSFSQTPKLFKKFSDGLGKRMNSKCQFFIDMNNKCGQIDINQQKTILSISKVQPINHHRESYFMNKTKYQKTVSQSQLFILCQNNDGNPAKYRTLISAEQKECLYYCSKCTVLLVNQGFILQQLQDQKIQLGRLNELKSQILKLQLGLEQQKQSSFTLLSNYYTEIIKYLQSCERQDQTFLTEFYKKERYQLNILDKRVDSLINSIDNQDYLVQIEKIKTKISTIQSNQFYQDWQQRTKSLDIFKQYFNENIRLKLDYSYYQAKKIDNTKNDGLRFSFEKLLININHNKNRVEMINPICQIDDSIQSATEKTAFRNLFPKDQSLRSREFNLNSPTFKHF